MTYAEIMNDVLERYFAAWNEANPDSRNKAFDEIVADDAALISPLGRRTGASDLAAHVDSLHRRYDGLKFELGGPVQYSGKTAHFKWRLVDSNGPVLSGDDTIEFAGDGTITAVASWAPDAG